MWRLSTICRLLRNEAYVGRLYWNRTHTRYDPALGRNRQTLRPREEWIEIPIPAIIDEDTFDAAETRARDNSIYSPRRTEPDTFLLRRLLRCAACGVKLVCHRAHRGKTTTRYYLCPHRDPWRAGGADRRCLERRVRADELDAFVFDQIRQLLARPDLLAAGETALAEQTPAADDELLAAQLDRLERRLQTTRSERGRIADLYQAGVIDSTEMRRRSAEIETRSRRFDQERQALIARQTELATDNRLHQHITGFAQQALAGIDALDFEGRQQLMRLMLEDVRVRGWQVELRLRIPLDTNPPTSSASDKPKRTRARSPRGSRPAKEAVSSNDRLRSIGERVWGRGRTGPQGGVRRRVDHQIGVRLNNKVVSRGCVPTGTGRPQRATRRAGDHQVSIGLHRERVAAVPRRAGVPQGITLEVLDQVAVTLQDQGVLATGRGEVLPGGKGLPSVEVAGRDG